MVKWQMEVEEKQLNDEETSRSKVMEWVDSEDSQQGA